jgi:tetratricopeptide (TPR) repeat protein
MAYVDGQSLKEKIETGPLGLDEALTITSQVAKGLRAAHKKGIIHRDIKPANIMLTEEGLAKIMDFGLAKISWGVDLTKTATVMGTVAYMSPEQARGEKVDEHTDIWSLGCVLYEMCSGRRPFKYTHNQAAIYSILNEEPEKILRLRKDVPAGVEKILETCLQKDPLNRYRDMEALLSDLKFVDKMDKTQTMRSIAAKEEAPSIAVLPFVNMSADPEQEYFCDGLAEELINLNPSSAIIHMSYSWFLSLTEKHEEAIAEAKRAQELDPLSPLIISHIGLACIWGRQFDKAIGELKAGMILAPNFYLIHYYLGMAYRGKSMHKEAITGYERAVDLSGGAPWPALILATNYFESDLIDQAESLLQSLEQRANQEYMPSLGFAYVYFVRNDLDKTYYWLERACEEKDSFLPWCAIIPIEEYQLYNHPRLRLLFKKSGLVK